MDQQTIHARLKYLEDQAVALQVAITRLLRELEDAEK